MRATLTPAYGRDYRSRKAIIEDLNAGKDFLFQDAFGSAYVNWSQLMDEGYSEVNVRYSKLRKVAVVSVGLGGVAK